jgi:steroid 5-alpha reductase family enzyme
MNYFFSFTFLVPLIYGQGHLNIFQMFVVGVWFIAWIGETLSDLQLYLFKNNSLNKGKVCNVGLWRYSRHPNYFFEWLNWWALALFSWGLSYAYLTFISPLLISFFLFKVTGIPMTETQALKSKGEAYAQYQKETSVFVPWFVKKA